MSGLLALCQPVVVDDKRLILVVQLMHQALACGIEIPLTKLRKIPHHQNSSNYVFLLLSHWTMGL